MRPYVSLPPGHVNATDSVFLTNRRTGLIVSPVVIAGGFDPVAINAALNNTVDITVSKWGTAQVTHTLGVVAARTALRLVRTHPVNASNAVALDASVVAVFSEPLNPAALSGGIVSARRRPGCPCVAGGRLERYAMGTSAGDHLGLWRALRCLHRPGPRRCDWSDAVWLRHGFL